MIDVLSNPTYYLKGIIGASVPRGEVAGTITFADSQNGLLGRITVGPVEGATHPLLKRTDALSGVVIRQTPGFSPAASLEV